MQICLVGVQFEVWIDDELVWLLELVFVKVGQMFMIGCLEGVGLWGYFFFVGGFNVLVYFGSVVCFMLGEFGGYVGCKFVVGDFIDLGFGEDRVIIKIVVEIVLIFVCEWSLDVIFGLYGMMEFFMEKDLEMIVEVEWQVYYNLNRIGVCLIGFKLEWVWFDGGEVGLYFLNIYDNFYVVGVVDFIGDMLIVLGLDGLFFGGFVCLFVVLFEDRWKLG